jgi:hypothetical protein
MTKTEVVRVDKVKDCVFVVAATKTSFETTGRTGAINSKRNLNGKPINIEFK